MPGCWDGEMGTAYGAPLCNQGFSYLGQQVLSGPRLPAPRHPATPCKSRERAQTKGCRAIQRDPRWGPWDPCQWHSCAELPLQGQRRGVGKHPAIL